ncbi:MAG: BatD family protein [Planctomycetaceae bacterium]
MLTPLRNSILLPMMFLVTAENAVAQSSELIVEIDRQQIYEGESFVYQITLNHVENPSPPVLAGFDEFEITSLGERSLNSSQITIINGRRSEIIRRGRQYNYRLTPKTSGTLTIPSPSASVDGETLTGREIVVRVMPPENQNTVLLDYGVDRATVYPTQPFTVKLVIAVKELPDPESTRDPLTVQSSAPALSISWLDDNQLPEDLQPQRGWKEILEPIMSRRGHGFKINSIGSSSAFSFFENRAAGFHPSPRKAVRKDSEGNDISYREYELRRTFIPQRSGTFNMGPVSVKGTFANSIENGRLIGADLYAVAKNVAVTVKDVPTAGRPKSWVGAVGVLTVDAELVPLTVRVGDPMTLTITLSGQGNLEDTRPPQIAEIPNVAERFRTYDATEETFGQTRKFVYSLRPLTTDVTEFPALPISYFNVETEQYVTVKTDPVAITVNEAERLSAAEIVASEGSPDSSSNGPQTSAGGVFANVSGLHELRNERIRPPRWFAGWGITLGGCFGLSIGIRRVRQRRSDPALKRQRGAPALAEARLNEAESQLQSGDSGAGCDCIHRAIAGVTAAWAGIPDGGLTARDVAQQLHRLGVDSALARNAEELLEACDAARYGAAGKDNLRLLDEARQLVGKIIGALRRQGSRQS